MFLVVFTAVSGFAASPGALDGVFDSDGKVATNVGVSVNPRAITVQPDGKIIAIGGLTSGGFFVVRYLPNGALDPTFDSDGIRTGTFGGTSSAVYAVALQPDGKIIMVGETSESGNINFAVVRLNPNGSFDTSFDTDGIVTTDFSGGTDRAFGVGLQTDGKIVVGGSTQPNSNFGFARYNPNGSLDTTFDTDGKVIVNFGGTDRLSDLTIQPDGKIIGVGDTSIGNDYALCRLNTNGSFDTSFNLDGLATTDIFANDSATKVALLPDGKIIAAGSSNGFTIASMARYFSSGILDTSFDGDGKVTNDLPFTTQEIVSGLKIQADGKILTASQTFINGNGDTAGLLVNRYNANGSADTSFGTNGYSIVRVQANLDETPSSLEILSGGKVLVFGGTFNNEIVSLARLNLDPSPSQSGDFDGDGFADFGVYRPTTTNWFVLRSSDNTTQIFAFGANGDIPLDGDFDGDGRNDLAIYRPNPGQFWFQRSSDNTVFAAQFGTPTDKPVPGDYDKDGKTDIAIFRPATGEWFVLRSSSNFTTFFGFAFGANGDIPITRQGL